MSELLAFLLPPAVALSGLRLVDLLFGAGFQNRYHIGLRFALGLGVGMLVFTQLVLLGALTGFTLAPLLSRVALVSGGIQFILLLGRCLKTASRFNVRPAHLWLLLLLPLAYYFWVFGRLSLVEGTMEFDGVAHWLIKSKIMFLTSGEDFLLLIHNPNLAYVHWDYPLLVPAIYTLEYGAIGHVDEFLTKVWPFWMVISLCLAVLSLGDAWRRPQPLPVALALLICFLPATLCYIHWEGATIPMVFYTSLAALLIVQALIRTDVGAFAASLLILTGCAMTKFEGMIYTSLWLAILLPVGWKHRWWKTPVFKKTVILALLCLSPYAAYRLNKPICHVQSTWPALAVHSPAKAGHNFPTVLELAVAKRFFNKDFANWTQTNDGRLQWTGQLGWTMLKNYQLGLMPWLTLFLTGFSIWRRHHSRTILALNLVIAGTLAMLAFVIACLSQLPGYGIPFIQTVSGESMGRYYYPFLLAWFLGVASAWFPDEPVAARPAPVI